MGHFDAVWHSTSNHRRLVKYNLAGTSPQGFCGVYTTKYLIVYCVLVLRSACARTARCKDGAARRRQCKSDPPVPFAVSMHNVPGNSIEMEINLAPSSQSVVQSLFVSKPIPTCARNMGPTLQFAPAGNCGGHLGFNHRSWPEFSISVQPECSRWAVAQSFLCPTDWLRGQTSLCTGASLPPAVEGGSVSSVACRPRFCGW